MAESITTTPVKKLSKGKECSAFGCCNRSYAMKDGVLEATGNVFFLFPKDATGRNDWCNLIKRQHGKDGFKVTNFTYVCSIHFLPSDVRRPPGGTRHSLVKGARPVLHSWNGFSLKTTERKPPKDRRSVPSPISLSPVIKKPCSSSSEAVDFDIETTQHKIPTNDNDEQSELEKLRAELAAVKLELAAVKLELEEEKKKSRRFDEEVLKDDKNINHYTAFPSRTVFESLYEYLNPGENGENIVLYNSQSANENETRGRKRILSPKQSFILTLVRLRRNFDVVHLAYLFKVSEGTVSNTISTWINFLYVKLGAIPIWPSAQSVKQNMTASMRDKFPDVKCIIDCVEFEVAVPSSLVMHKMMYSDYKSHTTVKVLVGIAPGGGFTFLSSAFPGSISDKEITIKSGLLNPQLWNPGEQLMADRGFTVEEYLRPLGVSLVLPSFLRGRSQFAGEEVVRSQQIANERIHVERMIQRLKCYHIFDRAIPINMIGSLNQIVTICGILANFQEPILKKND